LAGLADNEILTKACFNSFSTLKLLHLHQKKNQKNNLSKKNKKEIIKKNNLSQKTARFC